MKIYFTNSSTRWISQKAVSNKVKLTIILHNCFKNYEKIYQSLFDKHHHPNVKIKSLQAFVEIEQ